MAKQEEGKAGGGSSLPHHVILEERTRLIVTGVARVLRCDDVGAALETAKGRLLLSGKGLSVSELSLESGEVRISGTIDQLEYQENRQSGGGLLQRLMR